ncbi:nicotinate-nucleotide adenylyltransferase [Liberibacter crescens]|nr:nicotinate-nucleotide adenylyltransferase [Liberibacter crescens]
MPHVECGMAVGLFGGSFNPPHEGHLELAKTALSKLKLDQLWWMISPKNPFKEKKNLASLSERVFLSQKIVNDPRICITTFEAFLRRPYTLDSLLHIKSRYTSVNFIWLMGADNLKEFHYWYKWKKIVMTIPIAIIDRPSILLNHMSLPLAKAFDYARIDESFSCSLSRKKAPVWSFIHKQHLSISSTYLRKKETL